MVGSVGLLFSLVYPPEGCHPPLYTLRRVVTPLDNPPAVGRAGCGRGGEAGWWWWGRRAGGEPGVAVVFGEPGTCLESHHVMHSGGDALVTACWKKVPRHASCIAITKPGRTRICTPHEHACAVL